MAGMYVRCGSFEGGDKSASALDAVLDALVDVPPGVLEAIRPVFDDCYVSIPAETAALLLPCLRDGRAALVTRLGHDDPAQADRDACAAGQTRPRGGSSWKILYFGKVILAGEPRRRGGPGWELWCFDDVIRACETSAAEREPVIFVYR